VTLDEIAAFFAAQGLPIRWLADGGGPPMRAVLTDGSALDLSVDAAVVIPDVHLGIGRSDAFQEGDATRTGRLERFLGVLARLKGSLPAGRFAAVQLGDFFDVMRTSQPGASFTDRLAIVLRAYPNVAELATALPLLHCIGNHDHELFDHRADLGGLGINAHIVRALGPGVLAFHGNDLVSLANIQLSVDYQTWLLSLVQSVVSMPVLGDVVEALQRFFDRSLADPIFDDPSHTSLAWPRAPEGASVPQGWSAPWVVRDDAAQLGVPLLGWEQQVRQDLRLGIVGHSHRPGISFTEVADGQTIPLVDVGSWTYGRTNIAIVGTDGIGVAEIAG
jgi:hypothetical protein